MKKKFPTYRQCDAMDCGPTCLAMICKYYGKEFSLDFLHDLCHISNEGVSLYGISIAAEKLGFQTLGAQVSVRQLIEDGTFPCIIHWNQNHFVVLYKVEIKKNEYFFHIANPAGGVCLKFNEYEFSKCWLSTCNGNGEATGVILCMQPTFRFYANDTKQKPDKGIFHALVFMWHYIKPFKIQMTYLLGLLLLCSLIQLTLPFLTQSIVDVGIRDKDISIVILILLGQLIIEIGNTIVIFSRNWMLLKIGTLVNISLISDFLTKIMCLPISFFDSKLTGDIMQRINDHSRIQMFLTNYSLDTIFSFFSIFVFGSVIFLYNWSVSIIFFVGSFLYIIWVWKFMNARAVIDHKMFALNSTNQSSVIQLVNGMQEIKLNACEQKKRWQWELIQRNIYRLSVRGMKVSQYQQSGGLLINQTKNLIITALVATRVIKGDITLGMMLSIQYIVGMLNNPVEQLITFFRQYQDARLSLERMESVYSKNNEDSDDSISKISTGDIVIENMSYSYDKLSDKPTLHDINLRIPHGKTTAIVGLSGSGKTTLLKMILGFYTPDKGRITVGGKDLRNINKREWRKNCGIVMQDGYIFSDSIADNIAPNDERNDNNNIVNSATIANIHKFIEDLPLGYNTKIGNDGHGLSSGQKQRILIARAVNKNPEFFFLDEATNSLDASNEHEIMHNLNSFMRSRTAIIIAHRLSTVRNADNIVVMGNGAVIEQGTHERLITLRGCYYNLIRNQLNV